MTNQNENTKKRYPIGRYNSQGVPIRKSKKIKIVRKKYRTRRVRRSEFMGKILTLIVIAVALVVIGYSLREREIEIINEDVATASAEAATTVIPERLEENITPPVEQVIYAPTVEEVKKEIIKQSRQFGLNENTMLALADCESEFIWNAKNPKSTARGIFQYLIGTWEETESAKKGLERNNIEANIREAMIDILNRETFRWVDCREKLLVEQGIYL